MTDLVDRLRVHAVAGLRPPVHGRLRNEAADALERLTAENAALRSRLAKLQGGEACCVTHGEGACQLTCVKCNDELRSRLAEYELLKRAVNESGDCLPTCDANAHDDHCPNVNMHVVLQDQQREVERLRSRLADKEILLAQAVEYGSGYKQAYDEAMDNYQMTLARLAEAEALLRNVRETYKYLTVETVARIDAHLARQP